MVQNENIIQQILPVVKSARSVYNQLQNNGIKTVKTKNKLKSKSKNLKKNGNTSPIKKLKNEQRKKNKFTMKKIVDLPSQKKKLDTLSVNQKEAKSGNEKDKSNGETMGINILQLSPKQKKRKGFLIKECPLSNSKDSPSAKRRKNSVTIEETYNSIENKSNTPAISVITHSVDSTSNVEVSQLKSSCNETSTDDLVATNNFNNSDEVMPNTSEEKENKKKIAKEMNKKRENKKSNDKKKRNKMKTFKCPTPEEPEINIVTKITYSTYSDLMKRFSKADYDSKTLGLLSFKWLIEPITLKEFFEVYWEKQHLLIESPLLRKRFKGILSTKDIDELLRWNNLSYTKNIDITSYKNGKRETHNPEGRALASVVWDYYNSGCSIRLLNPQTYSYSVWNLLSNLQEYFGSFCGANVYLTPPGTQGFAPHWDDIEAFILQLEGKKRWRVYKWRSEKDTLPRESSGNFEPNDSLGELVLDCVLKPGDLLYFPRGFIHQGEALDNAHSLHITISTYQKTSWADLLEKLLPAALERAAESNVEFREGLPREYMNQLGIAYSENNSLLKKRIAEKVNTLVMKMMEDCPLNEAVDQMAKGFIHDALPPVLRVDEEERTIFDGGEKWCSFRKQVVNRIELTPETTIRLLRRGCARLVVEEESVRLFYSVENSREYHAEEPKYIEIAPEIAPGVEALIRAYPKYTTIENLPLSTLSDKMVLATGLWEKGIIMSQYPIENLDDDDLLGYVEEIKKTSLE